MAFTSFAFFSCKFLVTHNSIRTQSLPAGPQYGWKTYKTGCYPVPRRDRLQHFHHDFSDMQRLAPYLDALASVALSAVLGRYSLRDYVA
jgi:hypothetical protein